MEEVIELDSGRLRIKFRFLSLGNDIICLVTGGESHLGASSISECYNRKDSHRATTSSISVKGHKEKVITEIISEKISKELRCNVLVVAGVHYDNITKEEIADILNICRNAANRFISLRK